MPAYHRLDVSYQLERKTSTKSNLFDIGVYNAYNHKNVFAYYKSNNNINQITFFPILPYIAFTYKW
jgi:hypothetical protein